MTAPVSTSSRRYPHDGSSAHSHSNWLQIAPLLCAFLGFTPFLIVIAPLAMSTPLPCSGAGLLPLDLYTQRLDIAEIAATVVPGEPICSSMGTKKADFAPCPVKNAANTLEGRMHTTNSAVENVFGSNSYDFEAPAFPKQNSIRTNIFNHVVGSPAPVLSQNVCDAPAVSPVGPNFNQNVTFAGISEKYVDTDLGKAGTVPAGQNGPGNCEIRLKCLLQLSKYQQLGQIPGFVVKRSSILYQNPVLV